MQKSRVLTSSALAGALSLSVLGLAAPQASAATQWTTIASHAGGKVQACRVKAGTTWTLKVRVDNRKSAHAHIGVVFYDGPKKTRTVTIKVAKRKVSAVKKLTGVPTRVPANAMLGGQIGHSWGGEAGSGFPTSFVKRC